jgi:UDP-N-acetylglucosamine--N-acetylmuramyl-(pentapeptide) pyrophosphoryl-undecaprenol N-acetylglucosamine transferase
MIIVPLQKGSRGDQVENAQNFSGQGIAKMIFETDLQKNPKLLETELNSLLKHKIEFIKNMDGKIYNGTDKIIKQIEKYIK